MTGDFTVSGGAITSLSILTQGLGYALNNQLSVDPGDVGGTGSGFVYTLNSEQTGVTAVNDISLTGAGYNIGDVLSVDDATVGGGGGSGFQFTVSNVGFATGHSNYTSTAFEAS